MTDSEMCEVLGKFLLEIRKQSGEEYPCETVYEILMCIQGLLSIEGCYVKFLEDFSFMKLQNTLNNHMINLSKKGEL